MDTPIWPSSNLVAVVPHNTTLLSLPARQLYIGVAGDVTVLTQAGSTITFKGVSTGGVIGPFYVVRVNATGTTATDIVAFI